MSDLRKHSSTSNIVRFSLRHSSTGAGLTGLTYQSSGLIISTICDNESAATAYTQNSSNIEDITTLGTFATPSTNKCRFKEVDSTNHKGLYEFQFDNARFSVSNAKRMIISVTGATNLQDVDYEIQLVQFDPYDSVRLGLTAMPNVSQGSAGALVTSGTGTGQLNVASGIADSNLKQIDGAATNGNNATLYLKRLDIQNSDDIAVVITSADSQGLYVQGATNNPAVEFHGVDLGAGLKIVGGATGNGLEVVGGSTSGNAVDLSATTGAGMNVSTASGSGIQVASSSPALSLQGGDNGLYIGSGTGPAVSIVGGSHGVQVLCGDNDGNGSGIVIQAGGTSGRGIDISTSSGHGINVEAAGTSAGVRIVGGHTNVAGALHIQGKSSDDATAVRIVGGNNGDNTGGHGVIINGGPDGSGITVNGGAVSGDGIKILTTSGNGIDIATTSGNGIDISASGNGVNIIATDIGFYSEGSQDAMKLAGVASGGGLTINSDSGIGFEIYSNTNIGTKISSGASTGFLVQADAGDNNGMQVVGSGTGYDISARKSYIWQHQNWLFKDMISANYWSPGVPSADGEFTLTYSAAFPADAGVQIWAFDTITNVQTRLGIWSAGTFTAWGGWTDPTGSGKILYLAITYGSTPIPAGTLTITVNCSSQMSPYTITVHLPDIIAYGDFLVDKNGYLVSWKSGTLQQIAADANLVQIDGNPTNDNSATLKLKQLDITNTNGPAVGIRATGGVGLSVSSTDDIAAKIQSEDVGSQGLYILGGGSGAAVQLQGGATGHGVAITGGGTSGSGINITTTDGNGIHIQSGNGSGIAAFGGGSGHGLSLEGGDNGNGFMINGGATSGDGIYIGTTDGHGMNVNGQGTGKKDIYAPDSDLGLPTLAQIEASEWLLKTKTQTQNSVEVDPDGDVIVKTRRSDDITQFESVATYRQARYIFSDFITLWNLDSSSNPAITVNSFTDLNGGVLDLTGVQCSFSGIFVESGFYLNGADPIGIWTEAGGFVNDVGFTNATGCILTMNLNGGVVTNLMGGAIINFTVNIGGGGAQTYTVKIPSGTTHWTFVPTVDGRVVGYGGSGQTGMSTGTSANLVAIDGNPTNNNTATLALKSLSLINSSGTAFTADSSLGSAPAMNIQGGESNFAVNVNGIGGIVISALNAPALQISQAGTGDALVVSSSNGYGVNIQSGGSDSLHMSDDIRSESVPGFKLMEQMDRSHLMFRSGYMNKVSLWDVTDLVNFSINPPGALNGRTITFRAWSPDELSANRYIDLGTYDENNGWIKDGGWINPIDKGFVIEIRYSGGGNASSAHTLNFSANYDDEYQKPFSIKVPYLYNTYHGFGLTTNGLLAGAVDNPGNMEVLSPAKESTVKDLYLNEGGLRLLSAIDNPMNSAPIFAIRAAMTGLAVGDAISLCLIRKAADDSWSYDRLYTYIQGTNDPTQSWTSEGYGGAWDGYYGFVVNVANPQGGAGKSVISVEFDPYRMDVHFPKANFAVGDNLFLIDKDGLVIPVRSNFAATGSIQTPNNQYSLVQSIVPADVMRFRDADQSITISMVQGKMPAGRTYTFIGRKILNSNEGFVLQNVNLGVLDDQNVWTPTLDRYVKFDLMRIQISNIGPTTPFEGATFLIEAGDGPTEVKVNPIISSTGPSSILGYLSKSGYLYDYSYDYGMYVDAGSPPNNVGEVYDEPGQESPPVSTSLAQKINYLYKAFRNRITQDATTLQIYNAAGDTVDQKATTSDVGGTYTRGQIESGP